MQKTMKVWLGFSEGKPHFYRDVDYYGGVRQADVFPTLADALCCYEDVRRCTLTYDVPAKAKAKAKKGTR
jgi:hypothetical protein